MRLRTAIALGVIVLFCGTSTAFAFQEEPLAPPPGAAQMLPDASDPALALKDPKASPVDPGNKDDGKLFGFGMLPKLNFGLELLYSQQPMQLQDADSIPDEQGDVSVVGKIKRRF